jgi:hypothetical protein
VKHFIRLLLITAFLAISGGTSVQAQSSPSCSFHSDGSIVCVVSGGGNGNGGSDGGGGQSNNGNDTPTACTPGQHMAYQIASYDANTGVCKVSPINVDNCTGQILSKVASVLDMPCETQAQQPQHPCTVFSASPGGITCTNTEWNVSARVTFPEIYLEVNCRSI